MSRGFREAVNTLTPAWPSVVAKDVSEDDINSLNLSFISPEVPRAAKLSPPSADNAALQLEAGEVPDRTPTRVSVVVKMTPLTRFT